MASSHVKGLGSYPSVGVISGFRAEASALLGGPLGVEMWLRIFVRWWALSPAFLVMFTAPVFMKALQAGQWNRTLSHAVAPSRVSCWRTGMPSRRELLSAARPGRYAGACGTQEDPQPGRTKNENAPGNPRSRDSRQSNYTNAGRG